MEITKKLSMGCNIWTYQGYPLLTVFDSTILWTLGASSFQRLTRVEIFTTMQIFQKTFQQAPEGRHFLRCWQTLCVRFTVIIGWSNRKKLMFVHWIVKGCLGLSSLLNIWGHIVTVPACSSGNLTSVLPHRNPHVTLYRHRTNLSLCYPCMWNVTLNTQLPILMSRVRPHREILPPSSTHTANTQVYDAVMVAVSQKLGRKCTVTTKRWTARLQLLLKLFKSQCINSL